MTLRKFTLNTVLAAVALTAACDLMAQTAAPFPVKPIKLVVPFAPAGPNDIIARVVGQKWAELWGHPTVIENRGGAGGTIGVDYVSKAPPDGYTVVMGGSSSLAIAVGMYSKLGYDPRELTPLANVAFVPYVLAVNPRVPAKNVIELMGAEELNGKTVGFLVAAGGQRGYMGVLSLANSLMMDFRCWIVPRFVHATGADVKEGVVVSEEIRQRIEQLLTEMFHQTLP